MNVRRDNTFAVCVDLQEKLMPVISEGEKVTESAARLIEGLNILGVPVIATQHNTKGLGATVKAVYDALPGGKEYFEKSSFSLYKTEKIRSHIDRMNRENVLIFGAETHVCVLQSLISLREAGYNVLIIRDACGSRYEEDKKTAIMRAVFEGAAVSTVESILFELTEFSDCDEFKKILKLVK